MSVERVAGRVAGRGRSLWLSPAVRLWLLGAAALALVGLFMTLEAGGNWDFVLPFRARKVLAIGVVAYAVAASTVLFQTITDNRILTPGVMGFDALYMLIQTVAVFSLGSQSLVFLDERLRFLLEVLAMVLFSGALYYWLFVAAERSLHLLVLVGIIFGVMFRSVTNLLQRVIDPTEFAVLQDAAFASFNSVNETLLVVTLLLLGLCALLVQRLQPVLDALALGRETAICLGVDYRRSVMTVLALVTVMVAASTALVGPITFFGLLVANLAYMVGGSSKHRYLLPVATLLALIALLGGQMVLERVFSFDTSLSIIIEFLGGVMFIILLLRGAFK